MSFKNGKTLYVRTYCTGNVNVTGLVAGLQKPNLMKGQNLTAWNLAGKHKSTDYNSV
jgi:hypothetical protein